jgi:hypothetical protein
MAMRADRAVKALFKPKAAGWVYRAANPWSFGRPPHYQTGHLIGMGSLWVFIAACQIFQFIVRQQRHPLGSDALSYLVLFVLFLAFWFAITYSVQALSRYQDAHRLG